METHEPQWAEGIHRRIAEAIKNARQGRLTAQQLADECERLGYPISRAQIANYESGRKQGLDIAELLVLAAALGVPPVALLFPALPDGDAEALPGWHATAVGAMGWFTGEIVDENEDAEHSDGVRLVALTRRRFGAQRKMQRLQDGLELLQLVRGTDRRVVDSVLALSDVGEEIADINRQIATIPGAVVATERKGTK